MKSRPPTPEERKLWQESNRHTRKVRADEEDVETLAEDAVNSPPPQGEGQGGAIQSTGARLRPPPNLPPTGGGTKAPLTPLSSREATRNFKLYPIGATLDLHGLTKLEAHARVASFITLQQLRGHRHVVIITGKGRGSEVGVLRANLPDWLNAPALRPLISAMAHAKPEKGGTGVVHVLLKAL